MKKTNFMRFAFFGTAVLLFSACSYEESVDLNSSFIEESEVVLQQSQVIEGSYIVVFDTKITGDFGKKSENDYKAAKRAVVSEAQKMFSENAITDFVIEQSYGKVLNGVAAKLSKADVEKLSKDKRVKYIEEDQLVTLAPGGKPGSGGGSTVQETPWGITRVNGVSNYTGTNVAWVIDTGIDLDHPDLNVDASRGFNAFTTGRDAGAPDDGNGHGSHVSGTIAAKNNTIGVIGVAPGAIVIPIKVLDSRGSGSYSGVIAGVDFVAAHGNVGDVANMSLGGPVSQALDDAVFAASKNIKFALAAGNDGADANNSSPARVNGPNISTISAMSVGDIWASFSNYGNPPVDYCAPGVSIKSTWKGGGYNTISGTSMASPHAAGVLLLGAPSNGGTVSGDNDGNPDPIIVH